MRMIFSLSFLLLLFLDERVTNASRLSLNSNGEYENLVISIDESVPQSTQLITNIKEKFTKASRLLEAATRRSGSGGLSFKTVHILLPDDWIMKKDGRIEESKWQSFDRSDVRIYQSVNITDSPSTLQTGGCGSPGIYTRYTDHYFLNEERLEELEGAGSAPPEKMIVHQWAHYRWGVFDEHPTKSFPNQFYSKDRNILPVRCFLSIEGRITFNDGTNCEKSRFTNRASKNCIFTPDPQSNSRGSLMFAPQVKSVTQFCDSTSTDPDLRHNSDAPNHHNEICGGDSVWDVMKRHRDFTTINSTRKTGNTTPEFRIVQKKSAHRDVVMVMDVSGSMNMERLSTLKSAAKIYIERIVEQSAKLALVKFSSSATELQSLQSMNVTASRQASIEQIENLSAMGGTNIPSGLVLAFELLGGDISKPDAYFGNGYIILISDGRDSNGMDPFTFGEIIEILKRSSVVVDSISIGSRTDDRLKNFAENTTGKYFMADPSSFSTSMIENFVSTLGSRVKDKEKVSVVSKGSVSINQPPRVIATIDQESGEDTAFLFKFPISSQSEMVIISPSGNRYSKANGSEIYQEETNGETLTITVKIPGVAEPGQWSAQMVKRNSTLRYKRSAFPDWSANFVVMTKPRKESKVSLSYVGRVDCGNIEQADTNTRCPCTMVITNHGKEILNAEVTLVMTSPQGSDQKMAMLDNGIGSDVTASDGVYTASIVGKDLTQNGIYNIKTEMKFKLKPDDDNFLTRIETIGGLKVNNPYSPRVPDTTPPDRIRKVIVDVVEMKKRLVQLTFTAVGDDGDREKASLYQFKLNDNILSGEQFSRKPNDPGSEEKITLSLDKVTQSMNTTSFNLFIRAVDDEGNEGKWSMGYTLTFQKVEFSKNLTKRTSIVKPKSYRLMEEMDCQDIVPPTWNYRCIARVNLTDNGWPILNATVIMIIETSHKKKIFVSMIDTGTGSDVLVNDGIYSASIIGRDFTEKGFYRIIANITFDKKNGSIFQTINELIPIGFLTNPKSNPQHQNDQFPPDEIRGISLSIINETQMILLVNFRAVGDDGDRDVALSYQFQVNNLLLNNSQCNYTSLGIPGTQESIWIQLDRSSITTSSSVSLKIRAVDESGNEGNWSQPVFLSLKSAEIEMGSIILKSSLLLEGFSLCFSFVFYFMWESFFTEIVKHK